MAHNRFAAHVEQHCRQRKNASNESFKRARSVYESGSLRSWRDEERGIMTITIEVPLEEGALYEKAVDKAAVNLSGDSVASNAVHRSNTQWCAVQADAAIVIIKDYLCGSVGSGSVGAAAELNKQTSSSVTLHVERALCLS